MSTDLLENAVEALGAELSRVVFLGGATVGLWLSDPAARPPRVTLDVDVVVEVTTLLAYTSFQGDLRRLGFNEDTESGVICRWRHSRTGLLLDAVPLELRLAGFSGRWLKSAVAASVTATLPSGSVIRVVPPPWLLVTKLEALADRGGDDLLSGRDFEDVVLLADGREELLTEIADLPKAAADFVRGELTRVIALQAFPYAVEGALPPDGRSRARAVTLPRLHQLAGITD